MERQQKTQKLNSRELPGKLRRLEVEPTSRQLYKLCNGYKRGDELQLAIYETRMLFKLGPSKCVRILKS